MLLPRLLHDEANSNIDEANSKRIDYKEHEGTNGKSITASSRNIRLRLLRGGVAPERRLRCSTVALISMTDVNHHHPKAISNVKEAIVKGLMLQSDQFKISGFDSRDVLVGRSVAYEYNVEIDSKRAVAKSTKKMLSSSSALYLHPSPLRLGLRLVLTDSQSQHIAIDVNYYLHQSLLVNKNSTTSVKTICQELMQKKMQHE
ncbi:hypothetical protein E3N88_25616 [Mikania micrantha]|uniref:Uncharacterized protein n=1 Tax=Mikania micrantha TaxID=192012 RepID=A0A5N6N818_9ASTR|nr:hypothetical protein E3N88_25616 [Mikania micrantha]